MDARPFVLLADATIGALSSKLGAAVSAWSGDWGLDPSTLSVHCARAWERPASALRAPWQGCRGDADGMLWFAWNADFGASLQGQIFPPDRDGRKAPDASGLTADGALGALDDLCALLAGELGAQQRSEAPCLPAAMLFQEGSGALCVTLTLGGQSLSMLIEHGRIASLAQASAPAPALPPLALRELASRLPLRLPVLAGRAEVRIGALATLAVGDVLRLDRALDRPLAVSGPDGSHAFSAYLARRGPDMLIEVVPAEGGRDTGAAR
jgi:hypothetical protein